MITAVVEYLQTIPVICLIGLLYGIAFLILPVAQWIEYHAWVKKYGKDYADELARRW